MSGVETLKATARRSLILAVVLAACGDNGDPRLPPVTLTITLDGAPDVGVRVYFVDPDGWRVRRAVTDDTGAASGIVLPGGSVTAVIAQDVPGDELRTFVGVQPGEQFALARTTPPASWVPGAAIGDGRHGPLCCGPPPYPVTYRYRNIPGTVTGVVWWIDDEGRRLGPYPARPMTGATDTWVSSQSWLPYVPVETVDTWLAMQGLGRHHVIERVLRSPEYTLDMAGLMLPDLLRMPSFDVATRRVTWSETVEGAAPDLTTTAIDVTRRAPARHWRWQIVAPGAPGELEFPELPGDGFDWMPRANDELSGAPVRLIKLPGGPDAVRARAFDAVPSDLSTLVSAAGERAIAVESPPWP